MEQAHVLVVEDSGEIREPLVDYLGRYGLHAEGVADVAAARERLRAGRVDLLVLDILLPRGDGFAFCREVLSHGEHRPAVIFLSALDDLADRVTGLELGADDYVVKPFVPRELVSRIQAVLRRRQKKAGAISGAGPSEAALPRRAAQHRLHFGAWVLDLPGHELRHGQAPVELSPAEFQLLCAFAEHPRTVLSRESLQALTSTYGQSGGGLRAIDARVTRLRHKLEIDGSSAQLIKTARGSGYVFDVDVQRLDGMQGPDASPAAQA